MEKRSNNVPVSPQTSTERLADHSALFRQATRDFMISAIPHKEKPMKPGDSIPKSESTVSKLPTFMTVDEAAETLRCSTKTIYRRIESGELPTFQDGRHYLIDFEVVRARLIKSMARANAKSPKPLFACCR